MISSSTSRQQIKLASRLKPKSATLGPRNGHSQDDGGFKYLELPALIELNTILADPIPIRRNSIIIRLPVVVHIVDNLWDNRRPRVRRRMRLGDLSLRERNAGVLVEKLSEAQQALDYKAKHQRDGDDRENNPKSHADGSGDASIRGKFSSRQLKRRLLGPRVRT